MNSASKVGEIFIAAGEAFKKLADLTMQLHPAAGTSDGSSSSSRGASAPKTKLSEAVVLVAATAEETGREAAAPGQHEQAEEACLQLQEQQSTEAALALGQLADITLARLNSFRFESGADAREDDASSFYDVFDDDV